MVTHIATASTVAGTVHQLINRRQRGKHGQRKLAEEPRDREAHEQAARLQDEVAPRVPALVDPPRIVRETACDVVRRAKGCPASWATAGMHA